MNKWKIILIALGASLSLVFLSVKIFNIDKNKDFLNFISRYYFDEPYYLDTYPEVRQLGMDPFKHYTTKAGRKIRIHEKILIPVFTRM